MDLAGAAIVVAKKYARSGIGRGKLAGAGKEKKKAFSRFGKRVRQACMGLPLPLRLLPCAASVILGAHCHLG